MLLEIKSELGKRTWQQQGMLISQWIKPGYQTQGSITQCWDLSPAHTETHMQLDLRDRKLLQISWHKDHHKEHDKDQSHPLSPPSLCSDLQCRCTGFIFVPGVQVCALERNIIYV